MRYLIRWNLSIQFHISVPFLFFVNRLALRTWVHIYVLGSAQAFYLLYLATYIPALGHLSLRLPQAPQLQGEKKKKLQRLEFS